MSALLPPPGLEAAPPGWVWTPRSIGGSHTWSLEKSDTGELEAAKARISHRVAFRAHEESERAAREQATTVAERAEVALRVVPSDAVLGADCTGLSAARAALFRTEKWLTLARSRLVDAQMRATKHNDLVAKRDTVRDELDALESAVRAEFAKYSEYGSQQPEPDSRDVDRHGIRQRLDSAEWEVELSAAAGDGLIVATAAKVVEVLESRLPNLRSKILIETAQPTIEQIRVLAEQLREPLMILCGLGEVDTSNAVRSEVDIRIPMPIGGAVEISAYTRKDDVAVWQAMMDALAADPLASLDRPKSPAGAKKRLSWIRS